MKTIIKLILTISVTFVFIGCEHPIRMETKVHEDGSLDKIIEFDKADSGKIEKNVFNINSAKGWRTSITRSDRDSTTNKDEFKIRFEKSFPTTKAINKELDIESDTLFRIHSSFNKSFRWFYTYLRYSETLRTIDRFKMVKADDYFNQEDKSFINRLPGDGTVISKADSFYLQYLNEKIFKHYPRMGMHYEHYEILRQAVERNLPDKKWLDSLAKNEDYIFEKEEDMEGDPFFAIKIADSLHIPLQNKKAEADINFLSKDLNSRIAFMGFARDGKYTNVIEMPWTIVNSNADSLAGNKLFWRPLPTKFAIQEFEMFAEARKLNWWAVIVSLVLFGSTLFLFMRKRQ